MSRARFFKAVLAAAWGLGLASSAFGRDLQRALDELPAGGGTVTLLAGRYVQRAPLNMREKQNVRIVGAGPATELFFQLSAEYADMPLIDLTGAQRCELSHLKITGTGSVKPSVAVLLARSSQDGDSAGIHRFESLIISIDCTVANVAAYGSEVNTWTHCSIYNSWAGGGNYVTGRENHEGIRSPFGSVAGGSNVCHTFDNCLWGAYGRSGTEVNIRIHQRTGWFLVRGGSMSNKSFDRSEPSQGGRAGFQIGGPGSGVKCEQIVLDGLEAETFGARHAIEITGPTFGLTVRNCLLQSLESAVHVGAQLEDSLFQQNTLDAGMALYAWPEDQRAQVTVAATCQGNIFDLRWSRLGRLARNKAAGDESVRPERALIVSGDKSVVFAHNEIHVQGAADLSIAPGVNAEDNEVRVRR